MTVETRLKTEGRRLKDGETCVWFPGLPPLALRRPFILLAGEGPINSDSFFGSLNPYGTVTRFGTENGHKKHKETQKVVVHT